MALAAGVVALAAAGYAGVGGGLSTTSGSAGAGSSASSQNISARKADGRKSARTGDSQAAWRRLGMRELKKTSKRNVECISASFSRVQQFFLRTPCKSLDRILFAVADDAGNMAVVSVVWVGFRNRNQAREFKDLVDVHGTGDIKPLGAGLLDLAEITFTGHHYDSDLKGSVLAIAEAEPAAGRSDPELLKAMASVASQLPGR